VFNRESMPKETREHAVKSEISLADLLQGEFLLKPDYEPLGASYSKEIIFTYRAR